MSTMEKDLQLEPCPLCGGEAKMANWRISEGVFDATIVCSVCGLTLEWSQQFAFYETVAGDKHYIKLSESPVEAWNRRYKDDSNL